MWKGVKVTDMVTTKLFRNGGSLAVRIPAKWLEPDLEVRLIREPSTGRVFLTQDLEHDPEAFFSFMEKRTYAPDVAFDELMTRSDPPRVNKLVDEQ
jgi:virulence-associated protein VagC